MRWLRAAGPMVRSPAALPLGVMLGVAVVDALTGPEYNLLPVYAAGPAVAAGRGSIRNVVTMGGVAALLCLLFAAKADRFGELRMYVALVAIAYVTLAAVYAAWVRLRTERRLVDVQEVARTLEDVLFVPLPPVLGPVWIGASYVSASRATRVGGDLYKAVPSPYGVRLVIADVQGKGLGTIRCAAVVLAAFREAGPEYEDLTEVGRRIESALKRSTDGQRFVTGILAQISPDGQLLAFNQGHPAPLLRTADGGIRFVEPDEPVPPFGLTGLAGSGDVLDSVTRLALRPGDRLLLYTDGLSEARDRDGRFYPVGERAGPLLGEGSPEEALRRVRADVAAFTGAVPDDDSALILVEFAPRAAP
ncbi:PP2C family protein-serine/threonine phosphatase [Streptomyces sp. NBC_01174]|uniref:PP2C family protein-serine/threonine phosphatase n=1 Tax=Streptomyces sp. NBC_01174 TaxID=2903758 RepID=UPI00386417FD|nr:serine/threonine-protein phosphatase [Streptomyces sp. NBC_01177]WSS74454.1 serine/threonine-protein phosphatase [Streptomyces sp. NBC_01174]